MKMSRLHYAEIEMSESYDPPFMIVSYRAKVKSDRGLTYKSISVCGVRLCLVEHTLPQAAGEAPRDTPRGLLECWYANVCMML